MIARSKPIARKKGLARKTRVAPVNRKRRAKTFERNYGDRAEAVREMRCLVFQSFWGREKPRIAGEFAEPPVARPLRITQQRFVRWLASSSICDKNMHDVWFDGAPPDNRSPVEVAHVIPRGMGGARGDRRQIVPLCRKHHAEAGEHRTSQRADFERRYTLDLIAEAQRIAEELDTQGYK